MSNIFGHAVSLAWFSKGVATGGGQTHANWTPLFQFSWYSTSVNAVTANFEAS